MSAQEINDNKNQSLISVYLGYLSEPNHHFLSIPFGIFPSMDCEFLYMDLNPILEV